MPIFDSNSTEMSLKVFLDDERHAPEGGVPGGPFKNFLAMLHRIQLDYPAVTSPIRTALITAHDAPAHERVIRTLRAWNIRIDEALFLGGMEKGEFLRAFGAEFSLTISRSIASLPASMWRLAMCRTVWRMSLKKAVERSHGC